MGTKTTAPPMTAPKYPGVEESHKYGPITERKEAPKETNAPVYIEDGANKYSHIPERQRVEGQLAMCGPKFRGVDDSSKYNESPMKAPIEGQRLMTAPIFPGIEASNSYGTAIYS